ncbi:hypothetical protein DYB28_000823 [Aphanomyces astaci]|uniref:E3 ubiquitin-protein ligase listerin n=1 Tax=Aphanomyces astaci TaxID=112090 RepID=A0A9X8H8Z2_APHAT|nr:hypothetical protein DYB28_000823 [Aphanomyces astaci]
MGGKKAINQKDKLAQANASSSARAVQSLLSSNSASTGFIGFSAFATSAPPPSAPTSAATPSNTSPFSFYDGPDTELSLALKMLGKRDAQTKTKALTTLKDTLIPSRKPADLRLAVGQFCYLYGAKLMLDNDRRVRQLATDVLGALIDRLPKGTVFHNHMQLLLPPWYLLAMHDVHTETAKCAKRAFLALLPTDEAQTALLAAHADLLLTNVQTYLALTVESLVDRGLCTPDEADEWYVVCYERCVTSTLLGARALLLQPSSSSIFPTHVDPHTFQQFLASLAKFTTLTSKSATFSRASIRHATYVVLTAAATSCPELLRSAIDPKVVLGVVGEKFAANVPATWTLVLTYLSSAAKLDEALPWTSILPVVLPKVIAATKHANYGATSSLSNLLPFVSLLPKTQPATTGFYVDLLAALCKSLESPHVAQGQTHVVTAFAECLSAMWTIFPAAMFAPLSDQERSYVTSFEPVVTSAWTKALTAAMPDRSFRVFVDLMAALVPRLAAYAARQEDDDVATLAIALCHRALHAALTRALDHETSHTRMLDTLRVHIKVASSSALSNSPSSLWTQDEVLGAPLLDIIRALVPQGAVYAATSLHWLGQLLDLVGISTLFPNVMAGLATFHQYIAPSYASILDKTAYFSVWRHFAPVAPGVLWPQLLVQWDGQPDVVGLWKNLALPLPPTSSLLASWQASFASNATIDDDETLIVYATVWKSQWFDTRVMAMLLESSATSSWTDGDLAFFTACWGNLQPVVSPATVRQVLTWCHQHRATPKVWTLLESLLPLLVAMDRNEIWLDVLGLVDAVVANIAFHSWAVLCAELLVLDESKPYWDKLPLTNITTFKPTYRVLEIVGELCHWNHGHLLHDPTGYLHTRSPDQVSHWMFVDVAFALTWYTVDIDPTVLSQHVGTWIEPYLVLTELLEALGDRPLLVETLIHVAAAASSSSTASPHHVHWLQSILLSHVDTSVSDGCLSGVPHQFQRWLFEIGLDYLSSDLIVASTPRLIECIPRAFLHVALPRLVQCALDHNLSEDDAEDKNTWTTLTSLLHSSVTLWMENPTTELDALDQITHLLPLLTTTLQRDSSELSTLQADLVGLVGSRLKAPSSVVSVAEWLALGRFILASLHQKSMNVSTELIAVAKLLIVHAFAAKQDVSELVAVKVHATAIESIDALRDVHPQLLTSRQLLVQLVQALARHGQDHSSIELARPHRDALTLVCLRTIVDCLHLKPQLHVAFALAATCTEATAAASMWSLVEHTYAVEQALTISLVGLHDVLEFVELDPDQVARMILTVAKGRDLLWHALSETITHPTLQAALYQLLRLTNLAVTLPSELVDVDGEDEAATDAVLAELLITPGLALALATLHSAVKAPPALGRLLVWDLFLRMFPDSSSPLVTSALGAYVARHNLLNPVLSLCGPFIQSSKVQLTSVEAVDAAFPTLATLGDHTFTNEFVETLAGAVFYKTVVKLPTMVRLWWNDDCSRSARTWVEMTVRGSKVSREITTTYLKDECTLEMVIRVPSSYPLRSVEVECTKRIGISEERWRRWVLQILKVTTSQDGSLLDAVMLWKSNVDKEFDGVEPCPICFSILNPKTMGLPNLQCRTCSNKYHNSCLYKWFNQSSKNKCPICQQPFC